MILSSPAIVHSPNTVHKPIKPSITSGTSDVVSEAKASNTDLGLAFWFTSWLSSLLEVSGCDFSRKSYHCDGRCSLNDAIVFGWIFSSRNYLYGGCGFATFLVQLSHAKTIFRIAACFETFLVQFSHAKTIFRTVAWFVTFLNQFSHSKTVQINSVWTCQIQWTNDQVALGFGQFM